MKSSARPTRPSSRSLPLRFALSALLLMLAGCDDADVPASDSVGLSPGPARSRATADPGLDDVRARAADAFSAQRDGFSAQKDAFAGSGGGVTRSETRVGPQPWPTDLPRRWPKPLAATVVADTRRAAGDRLLLINLPGSPEHALENYREALRESGYRVDPSEASVSGRGLRARNTEHEAILTFIAREKVTRVEILFLPRAAG